MSDTGRQSFTDKVSDTMKPESQKTATESLVDSVKSTGDSLASTFQPESQKSTTQKAGDAISSNENENDESLITKTQNALFGDSGSSERR
ncbi:heat shock protein 9/12-domain-containing protein [Lentinula aciculospora]|uniref:Heat shock protein 9/12-domain-containing protein n=1 Tax=Lentinula aciculospora TaxID=153920 RepID=A0A9W9ARU8_9AGAR|nr:heat shock protein 9/12-domain-containing protein [Lentinula aciculospora]